MTTLPRKQQQALDEYQNICRLAEGPKDERYKILYPPYMCIKKVLEAKPEDIQDTTASILNKINDLEDCAFLRENFNESLLFCQDDIDRGHILAPKIAREKGAQCQIQLDNIEIYTNAFKEDATNEDIDIAIDYLDNTDKYLFNQLSRLDPIYTPTIDQLRQLINEKKSTLITKKLERLELASKMEQERKRLEEEAEERRQRQIAEERRQLELAEERRQRELVEQERQRKIAEERRQRELVEQERAKLEKNMQDRIARKLKTASKRNNDSPLMQAIQDGDKDLVTYLLSNNLYLNDLNDFDQNPLHYAAKKGNTELIAALIYKGVKVSQLDNTRNLPLHYASNIDSIYMLLDYQTFLYKVQEQLQADEIFKDRYGNTVLHNSVLTYDIISENKVLKPSLKKTVLDQFKNEVIKPLSENTDLQLFWQQNEYGFLPIHYSNSPDIIYMLINFDFYKDLISDQIASADVKKDQDGNNILHWIVDIYYQIYSNETLDNASKNIILTRIVNELVTPLIENADLLWEENNDDSSPYSEAVNYNLIDLYNYMTKLDDKKNPLVVMTGGREPLRRSLPIVIPNISDQQRNAAIIDQITRNNPLLTSFHAMFERVYRDPGIASTIDSLLADIFEGRCGSFTSADVYHILWRELIVAEEPSNLALAMIQYGIRVVPRQRQNIFMNMLGAWYDRRIQGSNVGKMEFLAFIKCINHNPQIMIDLLKEAIDIVMSQRFSRASVSSI